MRGLRSEIGWGVWEWLRGRVEVLIGGRVGVERVGLSLCLGMGLEVGVRVRVWSGGRVGVWI